MSIAASVVGKLMSSTFLRKDKETERMTKMGKKYGFGESTVKREKQIYL